MVLKSPILMSDNFVGFQHVLHIIEGYSWFTYADSDICILSSLVVKNAAEIGDAAQLLQRLALDYYLCVFGCVGLDKIALTSVDDEAQSCIVIGYNDFLFLRLLLVVGEKSLIIGKVEVFQLFLVREKGERTD
ncbi:hypothetical protein DPMN_190907 [Dreissena polymorpha]|uniref:Uncharacterized protein n=1 Tax=Dreissena polymorpha TaxID=45954 RepID=A0A9D4BDM8_DREPO|nr:hypothetical protein DPMN_190907 [Dreissena polymorpha]